MVVGADGMCVDCYQYAIDFLGVIADAFWSREMIMVMAPRGASPKGVAILTPDISAPLPEAVALANGLKAAGIPFDLNQGFELDPHQRAKVVAGDHYSKVFRLYLFRKAVIMPLPSPKKML